MAKRKEDPVREERIQNEVVVDAYGPQEQAMGWYYYLEEKIRFPFQAKCIVAKKRFHPSSKGKSSKFKAGTRRGLLERNARAHEVARPDDGGAPVPTAGHQREQSRPRSHRGLALLGGPGILFLSSPRLLTVHPASLKESGT